MVRKRKNSGLMRDLLRIDSHFNIKKEMLGYVVNNISF
jgi:hypothetical protein